MSIFVIASGNPDLATIQTLSTPARGWAATIAGAQTITLSRTTKMSSGAIAFRRAPAGAANHLLDEANVLDSQKA